MEKRYSFVLSLTSTLDGSGWSTPRPKTLGCKTVTCACPIATYVTTESSTPTFRRFFGHICNTLTYALWCAMGMLQDHNIKYIKRSKCWSENLNGRVHMEGKWETTFKWTLLKPSGTTWTRFIQLRAAITGGNLRKLLDIWLPYKAGNVTRPALLPDVMRFPRCMVTRR